MTKLWVSSLRHAATGGVELVGSPSRRESREPLTAARESRESRESAVSTSDLLEERKGATTASSAD